MNFARVLYNTEVDHIGEQSMKKRIMLIGTVILLVSAVSVSAREQVRFSFNLAADFIERPTLGAVQTAFDDHAKVFWGPSWEVILDNVGFGMHYLVKFDRLTTGQEYPLYDWSLDWLGDLYLSYHIFGVGRLLDPFIEIGFGNAGRVDLDATYGYWVEDASGEWDYMHEWHPSHSRGAVSNMSLFPYIGAGLALDFDGIVLGARINYRPLVLPIPGTQFYDYPLTNIQVGFSAGIALGGH
jgi:hypothetical protein